MSVAKTWALVLPLTLLISAAASNWVPAGPELPPRIDEPRWQHTLQHEPRLRGAHMDAARPRADDAWPYGPFRTRGRDIVDSRGEVVTWSGANWPLNDETMLPEGLEFASAEEILEQVASVGFNFVRMGYPFEMVDQIYDRDGEDVPLEVSMIMGLGLENGTKVTNDVVKQNPSWTPETTRFEIWSDIVNIAHEKGLFIHPDLHVGKAMWCCSHTDGNAWFDDVYFNTTNWHRALAYIASWSKSFPNIVSMSLRNELRESWNDTNLFYNWQTLVGNMSAGADTIHTANPDLLITWSGMQYDQDLSALTSANKNILTAPCYKCTAIVDRVRREPVYFDLDSYPWGKEKLVWELHLYNTSEDVDTGTCDIVKAGLYRNGFNALGIEAPDAGCNRTGDCPPPQRLTPVILSEFGQTPEDGTIYQNELLNCIRNFTTDNKVSWAMWSLAGYFRTRQGVQGFVDPKGMFNTTFNGWHDPSVVDNWWKPWVAAMNVTRKE